MALGLFIYISTYNPTPPQTSSKAVDPSSSLLVKIAIVSEVAGNNQEMLAHASHFILLNTTAEK